MPLLTATEFFLNCDADMLSELFCTRLDFKARVSLLACNKSVRAHVIRRCRRAVDSHVTYESYARKRLRALPSIELPNTRLHADGVDRDDDEPSSDFSVSDIFRCAESSLMETLTLNPLTQNKIYEFGITMMGERNCEQIIEATLRPTTDMLIPELGSHERQLRLAYRANEAGRAMAAFSQPFFTLRPNAKGVHQSRGLGVVRNHGYPNMEYDTTRGRPVSKMLETLMLDPDTVTDPNASLLVMLTTPLSHIMQRQGRSWACYMGRMRASLAQDDGSDPASLEQRLQVDDALAIRALFVLSGAVTMVHHETGRKKTALVMNYIGLPLERIVHRIE